MSLTYGFYDSVNGDRKYSAEQMASIFDGVINDGVFATVGSAMLVTPAGGLTVNVGTGKAWFNHTWTVIDSVEPCIAPPSHIFYDRVDALVLEINKSPAERKNSLKFISGLEKSDAENPTLTNDQYVHQYPLAYIYRKASSNEITESDITLAVGTDECPYVTGLMQVISIEDHLSKWGLDFETWESEQKQEFNSWFAEIKDILDKDTAGHLQNEIVALQGTVSEHTELIDDNALSIANILNEISGMEKAHFEFDSETATLNIVTEV